MILKLFERGRKRVRFGELFKKIFRNNQDHYFIDSIYKFVFSTTEKISFFYPDNSSSVTSLFGRSPYISGATSPT
jgi:hypothetical protein